ncbi:MAG: hypothetical protein K8R90_07505 [Candidatus Cloacimonetes bacterium]|nr:hypothetical protein [Candidatus Cloacimonadota bacterium]
MRYTTCIILLSLAALMPSLAAQTFDIEVFSDPQKYGWNTFEQRSEAQARLLERQQLLQVFRMQRLDAATNVAKSAIAPGWGHFSAQSYTKGQVLLGIQVILLGSSFYFYDQAMENYNRYKQASQIDQMNQAYNDALEPYRFAQAFFGLFAIVWGYTLFDTYMVTEEYNAGLWNVIVEEYNRGTVQLTPTGISVRF